MTESGFDEACAELMAKYIPSLAIEEEGELDKKKKKEGEDEKKVEEMKNFSTSIVQCELLVRDFSACSIKSTEKVQMRCKNVIKIGNIEDFKNRVDICAEMLLSGILTTPIATQLLR